MDEIAKATRTPQAAAAPDTELLFQSYRLGPYNLTASRWHR
jgi:hypothetical protein